MSSKLISRMCWSFGCCSMAIHQVVNLSFKNPENPSELDNSILMDRAILHNKVNALAICLMGVTVTKPHLEKHLIYVVEPIIRRRLPHFLAFSLFFNAFLFQSLSIYGVLINKDIEHAGSLQDALNIGDAF